MNTILLLALSAFLVPTFTFAATPSDDLSNLMGALNQVIAEKTQVPGMKENTAQITPPAQKVFQALQTDLENCQTTKSKEPEVVVVEKDGVSVQFKKFDLTISGERCPLDLTVNLTSSEQSQQTLSAKFVMRIVFKSDAFIQKYKLKFIEASGDIKASAQKTDTTVTVPVHINISSKGESTELGPISQSIGFDMTLSVNLAQFSFDMLSEQTAIMHYQGKTQKGVGRTKMAGFSQPEASFTIDDKVVSHTEFQTFLQSFSIPGMISEDDPSAPDSRVKSLCQFVAFDKNAISAADLKSQLQSNSVQSAGLLTKGQSCMKDLKVPFQKDQQTYGGEMAFGSEWISFAVTSSSVSEAAPTSVFVIYGDQSAQTAETDTLILGLQCQAAPACQ